MTASIHTFPKTIRQVLAKVIKKRRRIVTSYQLSDGSTTGQNLQTQLGYGSEMVFFLLTVLAKSGYRVEPEMRTNSYRNLVCI